MSKVSKKTVKSVKASKKNEKRVTKAESVHPGRPPKFAGNLLKVVLKAIKANKGNLSHARATLAESKIAISLPTIGKLAHANHVEVKHRGRPVEIKAKTEKKTEVKTEVSETAAVQEAAA